MSIITVIAPVSDLPFTFLTQSSQILNGRKGRLTNPLQIFAMTRPYLVLQNCQEISQNVQSCHQQLNPLVHLQVAPYCAIHGLELGFRPEELGTVKYRTLEMDVYTEDE
jgi:hypothetical protein